MPETDDRPAAPAGDPSPADHPTRETPFSFAERLWRRYGEAVDPRILLDEQGAAANARLLDARLDKLASRAAAAKRYTILGEIARGGMGLVLKVWDGDFQRPLAMKVIPSGKDSRESAAEPREVERLYRFLSEAQITAQMDHHGVVPVHDIGINAHGDVYFTMGLIQGRDLAEVIGLARRNEQGWSLTRALEVIVKVCETVAFAHSKGVIHRDLKPSNIMVGRFGQVYVMDWGLAKVLGRSDPRDLRVKPEASAPGPPAGGQQDPQAPVTPLMTLEGSVIGTPSYMPPEQAQGNIESLGPHSDVYSVGAMIYTLLTGQMPYVKPGAEVSPSAILLAVRNGPPPPILELDPGAPAEVAAICEKAMARKPEERYTDMNALIDDLRAYLESRVVAVYRTGMLAKSIKWTARNKSLASGMAAALAVAVAAGFAVSRARGQADAALRLARQEVMEAHDQAAAGAAAAARQTYAANIAAAAACLRARELTEARRHLEACPEELHGWEWHHLNARAQGGGAVWRVHAHEGKAHAIAFSPDGRLLASGGADGAVRLWDVALKRTTRTLKGHEGEVRGVACGPDGWVASASADGTARLWQAERDEASLVLRGHRGAVNAVAFGGEGGRLISGGDDGTLKVWEAEGGKPRLTLEGHAAPVTAVASSPDGTRLASASQDGVLRLWNGETGEEVRLSSRPAVVALALSAGWLAAAAAGGEVELRNAASGEPLSTLPAGEGEVSALALDPGGERLATGAEDGRVRLWLPDAGPALLVLLEPGDRASALTFSPDGAALAAASWDGSLTIWDAPLKTAAGWPQNGH